MFYDNFKEACEIRNTTVSAVLKELNISSSNGTAWKKGVIPSADVVVRISQRLNVSTDYLLMNDGSSDLISSSNNVLGSLYNFSKSYPQRLVSIRRGSSIPNKQLYLLSQYLQSDTFFLCDDSIVNYNPVCESNISQDYDSSTIVFDILAVFDDCADNKNYATLQLQISRIILYWLGQKGFTPDKLKEYHRLEEHKLEYIATGRKNIDPTLNYGFNFSDLCTIRELTGLSYHYMFTGSEQSEEERLRARVAELEKENAELKEKNSPLGNY